MPWWAGRAQEPAPTSDQTAAAAPAYPRENVSRVRVDPHLRGHVTEQTLDRLREHGSRVLRIGAAALIRHDDGLRAILGVWGPADQLPAWAHRLDDHHRWLIGRGLPTPVEARREAAWLVECTAIVKGGIPWWAVSTLDADGRITVPRERQPWRLS